MADVAHSTLTGADLHEPKGIAAATANKVYVSNGSGSGTWTTLPSAGRWILISTSTPSSAANVGITGFNSTLYSDYKIVVDHLIPVTNGADLFIRTSTNGGSSYDSGSGNYGYVTYEFASSITAYSNSGATEIKGVESARNDVGVTGEVLLINPAAVLPTNIFYNFATGTGGNFKQYSGVGERQSSADVDGIQFLYSTGNISSGTLRFYGLLK